MRPPMRATQIASACLALTTATASAQALKGVVQGGGKPIANSTVTLYAATASAPARLGQARSSTDGRFEIAYKAPVAGAVLYVVAAGGAPGG